MATTLFDCARVPGEKNCSVKIVGEHDDVQQAAHDHMVSAHGMTAGSDLKQQVGRVIEEHQTQRYGTWYH